MKMHIQFPDGSWILGERKVSIWLNNETHGIYHYTVLDGSNAELKQLIGKKVAVPIISAKYFILNADK